MKKRYFLLITLLVVTSAFVFGQKNNTISVEYKKNESVLVINAIFNNSTKETVPILINSDKTISLTSISAICNTDKDFKLFYQKYINDEWSDWVKMSSDITHSGKQKLQGEFIREKVEKIKFKIEDINKVECDIYIYLIPKKDLSLLKERSFSYNRNSSVSGCSQPFFVSRSDWCYTGDCDSSNPVNTLPITHVIVHHQGNSSSISPPYSDVVNVIYLDHTVFEGFDNIGYHWIIDPDGVLYQGTDEGVRGAHFSCMNSNTIGICLLDNFNNQNPTPQALETLKDLIAYIGTKYGILINESSTLNVPNININNLSGHRDGNPYHNPGPACTTTDCPGDNLYGLLTSIRNDVSNYPCYSNNDPNCNLPINLNITNIQETSAIFNWSLSNALGYEIEYRIVNGSWIPAASTTQTATSWNLSGLNSDTNYEVKIKGICSGGRESNWAYVSFTTDGVNNNTPPNDNCTDAITLTSNTSCNNTGGTVADATPSVGANTCEGCMCKSPDDYDVYYKFTAIETSHTVTRLSPYLELANKVILLSSTHNSRW